MPSALDRRVGFAPAWAAVVLAHVLMGCHSRKEPVYQDKQGFRFAPPPGWTERARDDALPARSMPRHQELPLPPLGAGKAQERLLVRYDRLTTGDHAWLQVTVTSLPSSASLKACLSARSPGTGWKREVEAENVEVAGLPAARLAFVGRWEKQDYLCETVAVCRGDNTYFVTGSFPASDTQAREQVRRAVATALWP